MNGIYLKTSGVGPTDHYRDSTISWILINAPKQDLDHSSSHEGAIFFQRHRVSNVYYRIQHGQDLSGNSEDITSILSPINLNALVKWIYLMIAVIVTQCFQPLILFRVDIVREDQQERANWWGTDRMFLVDQMAPWYLYRAMLSIFLLIAYSQSQWRWSLGCHGQGFGSSLPG